MLKILCERHPACCCLKKIALLRAQPLQFCRPVTRMKAATSALMKLALIKILPQLLRRAGGTGIGPTKKWSDGSSLSVDTDQTMPKTGNRNQIDARQPISAAFEQEVDCPQNMIDQGISVSVGAAAQSLIQIVGELNSGAFDLIAAPIKQHGAHA